MDYKISKQNKILKGKINLSGSKSESNRVLIIQALAKEKFHIENISNSEDTKLLQAFLNFDANFFDVKNAGTVMRFLTSFFALKTNQEIILTGSERMKERPIGFLVNELKNIGANIEYLEKENFPPIKIKPSKLTGGKIFIDGSISSQYITSLLLISPLLDKGLTINITNKLISKPYVEMTLKMMEHFGIKYQFENNKIIINRQNYISKNYIVESDWSSASYWYLMSALSDDVDLEITGLKQNSLQGDFIISDIMSNFGVKTKFLENKIHLSKSNYICKNFSYDFSNYPDIAQTIAVLCSALGINAKLTGLDSLRIKETDRINALIFELKKLGVDIKEKENSIFINSAITKKNNDLIRTYKDHRMAMSFSPLAIIWDTILIEDVNIVEKSYPNFWNDLKSVGFKLVEKDKKNGW